VRRNSHWNVCYDPTKKANAAESDMTPFGDFGSWDDEGPWTLTLTGKDLVVFGLVAVNLALVGLAVYFLCTRRIGKGQAKYERVEVVTDSEMDSESVALRN
jgi:hypothetical protein